MVSWLAKFNPLYMVLTAFLVVFLQSGAKQVSTDFRMDESISDIITAVILFFIIGCEFFINYKIVFRKSHKEGK
jgi:simple sugar transport system permease protein